MYARIHINHTYTTLLYVYITAVRNATGVSDNLIGLLLGCKSDLRLEAEQGRAEVVQSDAVKMSGELRLGYQEVSAANNINIEEPFKYIAQEYYKRQVYNIPIYQCICIY